MNDLVACATCETEVEVADGIDFFVCLSCGEENTIEYIEEVEELTEEKWELITSEWDILKPNVSILATWCSGHRRKTDHLWTGYKLRCLLCWPSSQPKGFQLRYP